jgi:hypothetical protein
MEPTGAKIVEFTFRISEADYVAAARLREGAMKVGPPRAIVAWVWFLLCLFAIWFAAVDAGPGHPVQAGGGRFNADSRPSPVQAPAAIRSIFRPAALLLLAWSSAPWFLLYSRGSPRLRKAYRKDPLT